MRATNTNRQCRKSIAFHRCMFMNFGSTRVKSIDFHTPSFFSLPKKIKSIRPIETQHTVINHINRRQN